MLHLHPFLSSSVYQFNKFYLEIFLKMSSFEANLFNMDPTGPEKESRFQTLITEMPFNFFGL